MPPPGWHPPSPYGPYAGPPRPPPYAWEGTRSPPPPPNWRRPNSPFRDGGVIDAEFEEVGSYRQRPPRDTREYPLGFEQPGILGVTVMDHSEAEMLARQATAGLVESLTTGKPFDFQGLAWRLASRTGPVDVISRPQIVFRGERLVLGERVAKYFNLIDIKVGNRSQLANSTMIPGSAFLPEARPMKLVLDTAIVGMDIALIVENTSRRTRTFRAVLVGSTAL